MMNKKTADQLGIAKAMEQAFEEANAVLTSRIDKMPEPLDLFEWSKRIKQDVVDIPSAMNHEQRLGRLKKLVGTTISAIADIYRLEMYKSLGFMEKHAPNEAPVAVNNQ